MNSNLEKIAFGSNLEILAIDSQARIPIIYGNRNSESINIRVSNKDGSKVNEIIFPLAESQVLNENDYIDKEGLHINDELIDFNDDQIIAYGELQSIILFQDYTRIYSSNESQVTMKVYYSSITARDSQIYVLDKYEQLIAVFNKEDNDTLINPRIEKKQNSESIFTFSIDLHNPKWKEIDNPENLYMVDGMIFSTNFDDSFEETLSENDEKLMNVTAYERQKLLSRKYVRTWNSITNLEKIDTFMVVVLAKGNQPLTNNDNLVNSTHIAGTSGYALDALLYGTGWKTGDCDVEGEFDLETDLLDVYENILKVQELWGGILVFDSVNKIVHHRDETKWLPYEGYEVKYRKNMQSLEKKYNNKIITRLCPLGESNLNIKTVNDNSEWLENFSYTDSVLEGIENNPDITDPEQLKNWGIRKLKDLCKPSKELTVSTALLYQVEGYELETIDLNDIVDVINYNEVDGDLEQLRAISFEYGVWDKSDAVIELSDITLESTDIFKKAVTATNSINSGTLDASRVVIFHENGQSVSESVRTTYLEIEKTKSDLEKTDREVRASITQLTDKVDPITGEVAEYKKIVEDLIVDIKGINNKLTETGGYNLIKNSVGYFGNDYWEGTIVNSTDTDIRLNNVAFSAISLQGSSSEVGVIVQNLVDIKNGTYSIAFNYKKLIDYSEVKVKISGLNKNEDGSEEYIILDGTGWQKFENEIKITDNSFRIEFVANRNNCCWISDLILYAGSTKQIWSQNPNETMSDGVSIGKGIRVSNSAMNTITKIDADGNRIYRVDAYGNPVEIVNRATEDGNESKSISVRENATINRLFITEVSDQTWLTGL